MYTSLGIVLDAVLHAVNACAANVMDIYALFQPSSMLLA
jgi:hypothetical protein